MLCRLVCRAFSLAASAFVIVYTHLVHRAHSVHSRWRAGFTHTWRTGRTGFTHTWRTGRGFTVNGAQGSNTQ
uniref:Uncharacterized protein n=1 Tax=Anopheles dirus TaxID=7168 RepID=A0A182NYF8_9DIPT